MRTIRRGAVPIGESSCRGIHRAITAITATMIVGCQVSDHVSVAGRVTRNDGAPVMRCRVVFRSPTTGATASGVTDRNGYYELGMIEPGDGVPPGEYHVSVIEDRGNWDNPNPRTIHAKYESTNTSGLVFTVEPGHEADLNLVLDTPKGNKS